MTECSIVLPAYLGMFPTFDNLSVVLPCYYISVAISVGCNFGRYKPSRRSAQSQVSTVNHIEELLDYFPPAISGFLSQCFLQDLLLFFPIY